uniref:palmitoyl-CoA hydrolase n=1 Tax=Amphiprion percula TaxID=161767 RepID=A0A3P8U8Y7_AMPPE
MMETLQVLRGSLLLLLLVAGVCTDGYKPVIIVHGLFDGPKQFQTLSQYIRKAHPGTEVTTIDIYDDKASVAPLWVQIEGFSDKLTSIMNKSPSGVHLLCFSQGGVICRALLSTIPNHNVHTFIALSSPLAGQYGETEYLSQEFGASVKTEVHPLCYNKLGQLLSICNYWKGKNREGEPSHCRTIPTEKMLKHFFSPQTLTICLTTCSTTTFCHCLMVKNLTKTWKVVKYRPSGPLCNACKLTHLNIFSLISLSQHGGKTSCASRSWC